MDKQSSQRGYITLKMIVLLFSTLIVFFVVAEAIKDGRADARNRRRVDDIVQIQKALKIYYDYHDIYPDSIEGEPKNITRYLEFWPKAPQPADGTCDTASNEYVYKQLDGGNSYHLYFCLGGKTKGFSPGYYQLGP
jgi:hypothetical protein